MINNYELLVSAMVYSLKDPILWIVALIFGWDIERPLKHTARFLLAAGFIWGCIRFAILRVRDQDHGLMTIAICIGLMLLVGGTVQVGRRLVIKYMSDIQ